MIPPVARLASPLRRNTLSDRECGMRRLVIKRRNRAGRGIADIANVYFRLARIPIHFLVTPRLWQRREVQCFRMLNPTFHARPLGGRRIVEQMLPGQSIADHLRSGTLRRRMVRAAGREFRRAHGMWDEWFSNRWSHGDAGAPNVIYDPSSDRARFIDFELIHDKRVPATRRQADDLLVFLLDIAAAAPERRWLPLARAFLRAYANKPVIAELRRRHLAPPRGLAAIWWRVRTSFTSRRAIVGRLEALARMLDRPRRRSPRVVPRDATIVCLR